MSFQPGLFPQPGMPSHPGVPPQPVLYRADRESIENLRTIRRRLHQICQQHRNQWVRIETLDGQTYTGRIVNCDRGFMYLSVRRGPGQPRGLFSPFSSDELILTLVLYELLVITLLYT
ncbi:hypothetical protein ACFQ3W_15190 [Paenibacillus puldeungensis]|uniref:Acetyl-CoA acetyltransferase n=1 Tax=Paenibacillus puldeungensis TaxID=696536 RepID=A0ABW3RYL8_9BACL